MTRVVTPDNLSTDFVLDETEKKIKLTPNVYDRAKQTGTQPFSTLSGTATEDQIPDLSTSKITSGTFAIAQIPTGITATTVALGNHTHGVATTTVNGLMSSTDKVKLNAIASQATKNDTDENLKNRANHTGTQDISTITGIVPIAQIPNLDASKITSGTLAIGRIPTGSGEDSVAIGNHTHSTATTTSEGFMSPEDKIKLDSVNDKATVNSEDSFLLDRANHTGTQPFTTLSGAIHPDQIPGLNGAKIMHGKLPFSVIPTGTASKTIATGDHTHGVATTTTNGFMSATDKVKLNNLKGVVLATRPTITITDPPDDENLQASFNAILDYIDDILGR